MNTLQQYAYDKILEGTNICLTSPAGCGKTFVLKKVYKDVAQDHNIALTSLTGISADLLGGKTLHSYLGIGLGTDSVERLYKKIIGWKFMKNRWQRLHILVIDEVSMLTVELFEKIEQLARLIRNNTMPFGGIQIVMSGDFLQLPTIGSDKFCFESPIWDKCIDEVIVLKEIVRQQNPDLVRVLGKIRLGIVDADCKEVLGKCVRKFDRTDGIVPTKLYAVNELVDKTNDKQYAKLTGPEYEYKISYTWNPKVAVVNREMYEAQVRLPYELKMKVGAQVIYLVNNDGLYNGARGVIVNFASNWPIVKFANGREQLVEPVVLNIEAGDQIIMSYKQIPLRLAFAISIHKSQSLTIDCLEINFARIFECGQFYTALSRCKSLDGLYLTNLDWNRLKANPKAIEFYKKYG